MKLDKEANTLTLEDGSVYKIELIKESTKRWKPKEGETYYIPKVNGVKEMSSWFWDDGFYDNSLYDTGDVFQTEEEARKEYVYRVIRQRVKDAIAELNDGWTPDWNNSTKLKYSFFRNPDFVGVEASHTSINLEDWKYIKSLDSVDKLREMFTDAELKLALFEIHE